MRLLFEVGHYLAVSQVLVAVALFGVATAIRCAWGDVAVERREDGSWPVARWLAAIGLWLAVSALVELVVLYLSFYPVRRA